MDVYLEDDYSLQGSCRDRECRESTSDGPIYQNVTTQLNSRSEQEVCYFDYSLFPGLENRK